MRFDRLAERALHRGRRALNDIFDRAVGGAARPVFFDIDETYPSLRLLDESFSTIKDEVLAILPQRIRIPRYHEVDPAQTGIADGGDDKSWRVFMLYAMHAKPKENRERCPRTTALVDRIPNLFQAFFSILDPGKSVPAHEGPYMGYLRYHLGLVVPDVRPPTFRVKDQTRTWREGESFLFDDSWEHEVKNDCPGARVILIVDVLRPMPAFPRALNTLYTRGVVSPILGRRLVKNASKEFL